MRRFLSFTFKREAYWLLVLCVLIPVLVYLIVIILPRLLQSWSK